jgi:hypothetical protein
MVKTTAMKVLYKFVRLIRIGRIFKKASIICVLLLYTGFHSKLNAQVNINLQLPPPGQCNPEHFTQMVTFNNMSPGPLQVWMTATVEEAVAGLIFNGTTSVFQLPQGFFAPHYSVYEPVDIEYIDADYEQFVINTNNLPPGNYVFCIRVFDANMGFELGFQCAPHSVFQPSAPMLVYPPDGSSLLEPYPVFVWLPPAPPPPLEIYFRIKMVEVFDGQGPYEAMQSNPAFFEEIEVFSSNYPYPVFGAPFETGKTYAWQVQSLMGQGFPVGEQNGYSEICTFIFGSVYDHEILPLSPIAGCTGEVIDEVMTPTVNIQFLATGEFVSFRVLTYANPCGRYPPTTPPTTPPVPPTTPPPIPPETPRPERPVPDRPEGGPEVTHPPGEITEPGEIIDPITPEEGESGDFDDWLDEGTAHEIPLPPGWEWGPAGPRWTGEHPPTPPELPAGWEWGPLRPVWTGRGHNPPEMKMLHVSDAIEVSPTDQSPFESSVYTLNVPLVNFLEPGQAFIYQVYGTFITPEGVETAYLSEPQCLRFSHSVVPGPKPEPVPCDPCVVTVRVESGPAMNGGLYPPKEELTIYRDEFVPLWALGKDYDELWWFCNPKPNCPETPSWKVHPLTGRVKYDWRIIEGEGSFVELGCLDQVNYKEGDRVIFMPPYVEIDSVKTTRIQLRIIDDNPTQPLDATVTRIVTIRTQRTNARPDQYRINIDSDSWILPRATSGLNSPGTCLASGPTWRQNNDLTTPEIRLPNVTDNDKLVYKQWIRLHATDVRDPDQVEVWCESECPTTKQLRVFEDDVAFNWRIVSGGGRFIKEARGRYVIYEAPERAGEVEIEVQVSTAEWWQIADLPPPVAKIKLKVYQPGVRMDTTQLAWLPQDGNELQKRSYLVYKDQDEWKPAFAHQCRIHFFEMMDVSTERGICLNWPPFEATDECMDLSIRKLAAYEVYDSVMCERWERGTDNTKVNTAYQRAARTKLPEREFTVTVKSEDYGGFGFIRSLANGDRSTQSPYESVGWKRTEKTHPQGRQKKTEYADNRVTIPRDIDENRIPDGGWQPAIGRRQIDPIDPLGDVDSIPSSNFPGDGISAYEEYRGFIVNRQHRRFNPAVKDLLIWDRNNMGLGFFRTTRIQCWLAQQTEMDTARATLRVINRNRGTHSLGFDQKGMYLFDDVHNTLGNRTLGTAPGSVGPGDQGLRTCDSVMVSRANIRRYSARLGLNNQTVLDNVIAHEMSHAVSVRHHGEGIINGLLLRNERMTLDGRRIRNTTADTLRYSIACAGGLTSGDINCWMRYDNYIHFCGVSADITNLNCAAGSMNFRIFDLSINSQADGTIGSRLTNTRAGNGLNRRNQCGQDATLGNCTEQVKVTCRP